VPRLGMPIRGFVRSLPLAFCLIAVGACSNAQPSASSRPEGATTTTASPHPDSYGLIPANPNLTDRIVLRSSRTTSGHSISGTLLVVNHGATPINLTKSCEPGYEVALTSSSYRPQVAFNASCSTRGLVMAPGINRLPIHVVTTYLACQQGDSQSVEPECTDSGAPPLPAGRYQAVLFGDGLPLPKPRPFSVILTTG
jgi:hypothetical protein